MRLSPIQVVLSIVCSAGCAPAVPDTPAASGQAIIGGWEDRGDAAVVALWSFDGEHEYLCTASLIAPRVLLTAAHCISDQVLAPSTRFYAFAGLDLASALPGDYRPVAAVHPHPAWRPDDATSQHDIGIAILRDALPIKPLPLRRVPLEVAELGRPLRLVGYGVSDGVAQTGAGRKRHTETALDEFDEASLYYDDTMHQTCNGDSGGPAFLRREGLDEIVGVTSYGDKGCASYGVDIRVDAELDFIEPFLREGAGAGLTVRRAAQEYVGGQGKADDAARTDGAAGCSITPAARTAPGAAALWCALLVGSLARTRARRARSR